MGRANQPLRPFNLGPYVQAMLAGSDKALAGTMAKSQALANIGDRFASLGANLGQRKHQSREAEKSRAFTAAEAEKNRALQREMQEKGQRLGWANLQFNKQATLLNELDDDLRLAQQKLEGIRADSSMGLVDEEQLLEAQSRVKSIEGRREAVRSAIFRTGDQTGIRFAGMDVDEYLSGSGAAEFTTEDECGDDGT